jgi:GT2 family glycosyltransferase
MIAICFVVHNQLQYTKWFIESIARNSYPYHLGFFALDNGSSDGSYEWLNAMNVSPKVVIRNEGNESLSKGWNRVLQAGLDHGADLLCLTNNDIIVGPGWLDAIVKEYAKVNGDKAYWLPNGTIDPQNFEQQVRDRAKTGRTYPGRAGWCMFFKNSTVREFLPISEELRLWYGDDFIHWKLKQAGYQMLIVDDCCCYHYGSKTVQTVGVIQHIIDADRATYNRITGDHL